MIGSLLLKKKLSIQPRSVEVDHCGNCTACVDACPTSAIDGNNRTLVAEKCISTYTIEIFKDQEPPAGFLKSRGEIFGCDICQDVCPWNRKPLERTAPVFSLQERYGFLRQWFFEIKRSELKAIISSFSNRSFKRKLFGTAFDRPGRIGWLKNLR